MVPYFILSGFGALAEELVVSHVGGFGCACPVRRAVYPITYIALKRRLVSSKAQSMIGHRAIVQSAVDGTLVESTTLSLSENVGVRFDRCICFRTRFWGPASVVVEALFTCLAYQLICGEAPFEELVL